MLTKDQALTADTFHEGPCSFTVGPRGGTALKIHEWRRNGKTQTWKTRPEDYRVPVKHGLYAYGQLTPINAYAVHCPEDCPALQAAAAHQESAALAAAQEGSD